MKLKTGTTLMLSALFAAALTACGPRVPIPGQMSVRMQSQAQTPSQLNAGLGSQFQMNLPRAFRPLVREDLVVGSGAEALSSSIVTVHYMVSLTNGQIVDNSVDHGEPFVFTINSHEVIAGWDLGIPGMKVGGKRKLIVPPELAYGNHQVGPIPANSTLIFEIELLAVANH